MRCSVVRPHEVLSSSTNGPTALTTTRAVVVTSSPESVSRSRQTQRSPTRSARDQLDVVGDGGAGLDRRAHEGEDEAGVVVDEVAVLVLHAAAGGARVDDRLDLLELLGVEDARGLGAEQADAPVGRRPQRREPRRGTGAVRSRVARKEISLMLSG